MKQQHAIITQEKIVKIPTHVLFHRHSFFFTVFFLPFTAGCATTITMDYTARRVEMNVETFVLLVFSTKKIDSTLFLDEVQNQRKHG